MPSPHSPYYDHPVFSVNGVRLHTDAIRTLADTVQQWLWTGASGGIILGEPRIGKTTAMELLTEPGYLRTRNGTHITTHIFSIPSRDQRTITSVFRSLCFSCGLSVAKSERSDYLADKATHYLVDRATEDAGKQLVLIVDEMQRLSPIQFNAFAELHDKSRLMGIDLLVIFVGNDQESSKLIELIESREYSHIYGRFFTRGVRFRGLAHEQQVTACLQQYDSLRYPDEGPTYTEYFLPDDFSRGWRLTSVAPVLWATFASYRRNYSLESWGMQYFVAAVNALLCDLFPHYGIGADPAGLCEEAVRISGLLPDQVRPS